MLTRSIVFALLLFASALTIFAAEKPRYAPPTPEEAMAAQKQGRQLATFTLENGKAFEVVLEGKYMPLTVANFVKLAKAGFYNGLDFHRALTSFVQGGDPKGDGTGGPGYGINFEVSPFLSHKPGAISMVHVVNLKDPKDPTAGKIEVHAPNTGGSQFIIAKSDITSLDGHYAVFGWVKSGLAEVVGKIKEHDTIKTVTVQPYEGTEDAPIFVSGTSVPKDAPANPR